MIVSDGKRATMLAEGIFEIVPGPADACHQPSSVDLTIDTDFIVYRVSWWQRLASMFGFVSYVRPRQHPADMERYAHADSLPPGETFVLQPYQFALASTAESVTIPTHMVGQINGKSSWGRAAIFVHITAGYLDPGFKGKVTLELFNAFPVPVGIVVGDTICQLILLEMDAPALRPYGHHRLGSHYQGQGGVTAIRR